MLANNGHISMLSIAGAASERSLIYRPTIDCLVKFCVQVLWVFCICIICIRSIQAETYIRYELTNMANFTSSMQPLYFRTGIYWNCSAQNVDVLNCAFATQNDKITCLNKSYFGATSPARSVYATISYNTIQNLHRMFSVVCVCPCHVRTGLSWGGHTGKLRWTA